MMASFAVRQQQRDRFRAELERAYADLFANDPDYGFSAAHTTPAALAQKMTDGLTTGAANKDGKGIRRTCKALGVPYTYAAIRAFLNPEVQ